MKTSKAKFFCEHCGAEVPANARICKNCGRFFAAVRCPHCGTTGDAKFFKKGCPNCGYAMQGNFLLRKKTKKQHSFFEFFFQKNKNKNYGNFSHVDGTLPFWVYAFTICVFALVLFVFIFKTYA